MSFNEKREAQFYLEKFNESKDHELECPFFKEESRIGRYTLLTRSLKPSVNHEGTEFLFTLSKEYLLLTTTLEITTPYFLNSSPHSSPLSFNFDKLMEILEISLLLDGDIIILFDKISLDCIYSFNGRNLSDSLDDRSLEVSNEDLKPLHFSLNIPWSFSKSPCRALPLPLIEKNLVQIKISLKGIENALRLPNPETTALLPLKGGQVNLISEYISPSKEMLLYLKDKIKEFILDSPQIFNSSSNILMVASKYPVRYLYLLYTDQNGLARPLETIAIDETPPLNARYYWKDTVMKAKGTPRPHYHFIRFSVSDREEDCGNPQRIIISIPKIKSGYQLQGRIMVSRVFQIKGGRAIPF